jgi:hypothetical protein
MNFIQMLLQLVEVGKAQILVRIIPLLAALLVIGGAYDKIVYHGLNDAQSMDNAQLARQIVRHQGFTTEFLRPYAVAQLREYAVSQGLGGDLFPAARFPTGAPRILPDTYNAPGYPFLLAVWFHFTHPEFDQPPSAMKGGLYPGDRWIPVLNQIFLLLTAVLVFALGHRLFDDRVAWLSLGAYLATDMIWHYTVTALSTTVLIFLVTAILICALEIFCVGDACFENENRSFTPAWLWAIVVAFLLAAACLTRLHLVVLLVPLFFLLMVMPRPDLSRANLGLFALIALVVMGAVIPWFLHVNAVSGNPLGSNVPLLLYGQGEYTGNQIYCATSLPSYEHLFGGVSGKEVTGFRWHLEHAWNLLGTNPLILLFGASALHQFKRRRTRAFQWLLFGCAFVLVAANNLGSANPETVGPWNIVVLLFPCMVVIGSAFFFILLDRLNLVIRLLNSLIIITLVALTMAPLLVTLTTTTNALYNFPPYMPPSIRSFGQFAGTDEWITSDMPWATAWYADRPSLWLPDSITDFVDINDKICPSGLLFLTPVTWSQPFSNIKTGEDKEWFAFAVGIPAPSGFPLPVHTMTGAGGPEYYLWSDRPRWQPK